MGRQIERAVINVLEQLTPRQHNQRFGPSRGQPLHEQWGVVNVRSSQYRYSSTVRNAADHTAGGLAVLNSLESGARRHMIYPKHGKALAWTEGMVVGLFRGRGINNRQQTIDVFRSRMGEGAAVYAQVNHPGHRPFHMVQRAHAQVAGNVLPMLEAQLLDKLVSVTRG